MLESFQSHAESQSHVALYSPQHSVAPAYEANGQHGSAGASCSQQVVPAQQAAPPEVPPGGRDLPKPRKRRKWAPNGDDHLIYRMVKLDGSGQDFAAQCFGIHQSTVSRIVRRYERWEAHAAAREDGRLDPAERLRSLRWLAFERNEAMLTSCLRLAGEVERCKELSKSVTHYPQSYPTAETEVRNESWVLDRVGMAARFLRLAFRINMEQVKLAGVEPPPLPEPLTEEELAPRSPHAPPRPAPPAPVRERSKQNIEDAERSIMG
jgi:hypothetical protein